MTAIYHITHIDNLPLILRAGGLWCDRERLRRSLITQEIAHENLKMRRRTHPVPVCSERTLGDYVPFYFANRSPMLYSIHTGYVEGYTGGQESVVYLVASAESVADQITNWCFTDGHAVEAMTAYYDDLADLDKVDWDVVRSWSWHSHDDFDRKRRKQAEFLVPEFFPWNLVESIAVMSNDMKVRVRSITADETHRPLISIEGKWYYD